MPKKPAAKKTAAPLNAADPRFVPVAKAFPPKSGVSLMENKSGSTRGLMWKGKSFGMSFNGRFMLKLTEERAAALIAEGIGAPFSPAKGRVMKAWIDVTSPKADWVKLAREAHRLAASTKTPAAKTAKRAARK